MIFKTVVYFFVFPKEIAFVEIFNECNFGYLFSTWKQISEVWKHQKNQRCVIGNRLQSKKKKQLYYVCTENRRKWTAVSHSLKIVFPLDYLDLSSNQFMWYFYRTSLKNYFRFFKEERSKFIFLTVFMPPKNHLFWLI